MFLGAISCSICQFYVSSVSTNMSDPTFYPETNSYSICGCIFRQMESKTVFQPFFVSVCQLCSHYSIG